MNKKVKVKFKSKIDEYELELLYDGILIINDIKQLSYREMMDNYEVDTSIIIGDNVIINRTNGIEMFQEFIIGQTTVMDYKIDNVKMQFNITTHEIVNKDGYLKIEYSSDANESTKNHEIEIYYS
ncbi:DUF1934 family protein [Mycoplasmatota bacterium]|nr:DUF1934 family protein [Mycoplasmatota bacterium]